MKVFLTSLLFFSTFTAHAFEFEGRWTVEKTECVDSGNALVAYPGSFDVRCTEPIKEIIFGRDFDSEGIRVQLLKISESNKYDWWIIHSLRNSNFVSPYIRDEISLSEDSVNYKFYKLPAPLDDTSTEKYTFDLRKISTNKYKLVRQYMFKNPGSFYFKNKLQNVTQTLYLIR
ncbi:MAG: hypothetical protein AAGB31_11115 [Bdellovibrio sp.]